MGDCPFCLHGGRDGPPRRSPVKAMFSENSDGSTTVTLGSGRSIKIAHLTRCGHRPFFECRHERRLADDSGEGLSESAPGRRISRRQERPAIYDKFGNAQHNRNLLGHETRRVVLNNIRVASPQFAALRQDLIRADREHRLVKAGTGSIKTSTRRPHKHAYRFLASTGKPMSSTYGIPGQPVHPQRQNGSAKWLHGPIAGNLTLR